MLKSQSTCSETTITATPQRTKSETPMRPIGHCGGPVERIALCGAPIVGIPAFGDYDVCVVCLDLWMARKP